MKNKNYSKGYSLIELLVYVSLFVVISVVIVQSLLYMMKTYSNARSFRTLQQNGELIMERITRDIRQASSVVPGSSVFGTSPGTLALSGKDSENVAYSETLSLVSGTAKINIDGVVSDLSSNEVSVADLTFWSITTTSSDAIKFKLTLTTNRNPIVTKTFYNTVILRE